MRTAALISGGLDSVVLAHHMRSTSESLLLISIDYGQRNSAELDSARETAERLNADHELIDVRGIAATLPGTSLTDGRTIVPTPGFRKLYPELHGDGEAPTVNAQTLRQRPGATNMVPNRNVVLLAIAYGRTVTWGGDRLAFGALKGSAVTMPDTSEPFVEAFNAMEGEALKGYVSGVPVIAPFIHFTKADVVHVGRELDVPFGKTWSCYNNGPRHCGACHACGDRRAAFIAAEVPDPTEYLE